MAEGHDALDREGSAKRAEERALRERGEKSEEQLDILWLMSEAPGRRIAHRLLADAGCFNMSYTQGDPHHTSFLEGARNVGNKWLSRILGETPDQYALMMKENSNAR